MISTSQFRKMVSANVDHPVTWLTISSMTYVSLWILSLGMLVNFAAYGSIQPLLIGMFFLAIFIFLFGLKGIGGREERRAYFLVYSVGWFWAGIAAVYAIFFNDPSQVSTSDAANFFNLATGGDLTGLSISEISTISEGAGSIIVWRFIYDFFAYIGFEKGRHIGVTLNITFVSLSAVTGVKMMRVVFGQDAVRIRRFTLAFALCGMFWLFAAIHNRDAAVLLAVSLLTYYWVRYLSNLSVGNFFLLVSASLIAFASFAMLRAEFVFVPIAMLVAGFSAAVLSAKIRGKHTRVLLFALVLALPVIAFLVSMVWDDLFKALLSGKEGYAGEGMVQNDAGSLGSSLIVNQPIPIRLVAGFIYMFIFPVPFWIGFQLESTYHLFKSFHVLFMYAITPLFALAVSRIIASKTLRTMPILFLLFVTAGFTLSIVFTSLETRHLGPFLPALLGIAMLPDLTAVRDRIAYRSLLKLFLSGMFFIHAAWIVLKFFTS